MIIFLIQISTDAPNKISILGLCCCLTVDMILTTNQASVRSSSTWQRHGWAKLCKTISNQSLRSVWQNPAGFPLVMHTESIRNNFWHLVHSCSVCTKLKFYSRDIGYCWWGILLCGFHGCSGGNNGTKYKLLQPSKQHEIAKSIGIWLGIYFERGNPYFSNSIVQSVGYAYVANK